jgi:hypothetical protein
MLPAATLVGNDRAAQKSGLSQRNQAATHTSVCENSIDTARRAAQVRSRAQSSGRLEAKGDRESECLLLHTNDLEEISGIVTASLNLT